MGVYVRSASALSSLSGVRVAPQVWNDYNTMIERVPAQYRDDIVWPLTKTLTHSFTTKEARLDAVRLVLEHVFTRAAKLRIPPSILGFALRAAVLKVQNNKQFNAFNFSTWLHKALPMHAVAWRAVQRSAMAALTK